MKDKYIQEISEYQDILGIQIEREYKPIECACTEKESVYSDINCYLDDEFSMWEENEFITYILYLEHLTGITNKLGLKIKEKINMNMEQLNGIYDYIKEEMEKYAEEHDIRICDECGHLMAGGYLVNGDEYYCTDECLHKHYSDEEYNELYDNSNSDDTYWTNWGEWQ